LPLPCLGSFIESVTPTAATTGQIFAKNGTTGASVHPTNANKAPIRTGRFCSVSQHKISRRIVVSVCEAGTYPVPALPEVRKRLTRVRRLMESLRATGEPLPEARLPSLSSDRINCLVWRSPVALLRRIRWVYRNVPVRRGLVMAVINMPPTIPDKKPPVPQLQPP
jgi:hypothetical protein